MKACIGPQGRLYCLCSKFLADKRPVIIQFLGWGATKPCSTVKLKMAGRIESEKKEVPHQVFKPMNY